MLVDVSINGESIDIDVADPFRYDLEEMWGRIRGLADTRGVDLDGADVKGLIPRMIKGVAGCEDGCPADAKGLVSRGHGSFRLQYIEGGILSAQAELPGGAQVAIKIFPDF
ncbi:MAG: hypothetical protein PVG55_02535 [Nitrospirota bacterium]|jgi:hypothetical protein